MSRKLFRIEPVDSIRAIEGADRVEIAHVGGWQCVVKKGEFAPGDLALYGEIDSVFPEHPEFEFLRSRKFRIKTMKLSPQLGSEISQGILFPVSILSNWGELRGGTCETPADVFYDSEGNAYTVEPGVDFADVVGVKLYEAPASGKTSGNTKGSFPSFVSKTDRERVQNMTAAYLEMVETGVVFEVTEKLDGSSMTVFVRDGVYGVCSRNLEMDAELTHDRIAITGRDMARVDEVAAELAALGAVRTNERYMKVSKGFSVPEELAAEVKVIESKPDGMVLLAEEMGLRSLLLDCGRNVALQGEYIGPGVQKNRYGLARHEFRIFDVYDIDRAAYMLPGARTAFLDELGLTERAVPLVGTFELGEIGKTVAEAVSYADGDSLLKPGVKREGVVLKSVSSEARRSRPVTFKAISNLWLLENE